MPPRLRLAVATVLPLVAWLLPTGLVPIPGLTVLGHRTLAVFVFAVAYWILEPIPIWATSVLIVVILLLTTSDGGIALFKAGAGEEAFGQLLSYKSLMHSFAEPIILLFLGGFFLAMAATKYRLDTNLARVLLAPFGTRPSRVVLGMMLVTAVFSMFMSNTATTAMMLAVLAPVLAGLDQDDPGRTALALSVPVAANIGGIGTPIGTPPNAVAMKYLVDDAGNALITFGGWMAFAVPYVALMLAFAWVVLLTMFKPTGKPVEIELKGRFLTNAKAVTVYAVFAGTILLWLTGPLHGIKSYVVAMLPVAVFSATGIVTSKDLKTISWDVLWLVAGGFALGQAMAGTGLSADLVAAIPFAAMPVPVLLALGGLVTLAMATFMSHTATANLILPLLAALGAGLTGLEAWGGVTSLVLAATFAASLGMALPISTPPNAMAHATGMVSTGQMAVSGTVICLVGLAGAYAMLAVLVLTGFLA